MPAGSLHSLQADIERLSTKLQQSMTSSKAQARQDLSWEQLSAQYERLMRHRVTLRNSQPAQGSWAWMAEEPLGTTVGDMKQKIAALEGSLTTVQR